MAIRHWSAPAEADTMNMCSGVVIAWNERGCAKRISRKRAAFLRMHRCGSYRAPRGVYAWARCRVGRGIYQPKHPDKLPGDSSVQWRMCSFVRAVFSNMPHVFNLLMSQETKLIDDRVRNLALRILTWAVKLHRIEICKSSDFLLLVSFLLILFSPLSF